uniref:G4 n=1 Tax=Ornithorhynchus anatinus TaxID=9258 RepID=A7X5Q7_ORNAN|nr:G4 [Ornithorhynchus anatinus]
MFLRRLAGWLPRPWGRQKAGDPPGPAPGPGPGLPRPESSPENSGSEWDSAPETAGDGEDPGPPGPPRARDGLGVPPVQPGRRQRLLGWIRSRRTGELGGGPQFSGSLSPAERLRICPNLTRHLLDLLLSALLALSSPPLRVLLEALGFRGPAGLWLHGLLSFVLALHALHALLALLTAYPVHFACLFGLLQGLVLAVSLREEEEEEEAASAPREAGDGSREAWPDGEDEEEEDVEGTPAL